MGKINFEKAEQYFDKGLARMEVENLLYLAELSDSLGTLVSKPKRGKKTQEQIKREKAFLVINTKREIKFIARVRRDLVEELGIDRETAERLFKDPDNVSDEDIEEILKIRSKIYNFRDEIKKSLQDINTEEMIQKQIAKAKNKRFNIRDSWLPLQ